VNDYQKYKAYVRKRDRYKCLYCGRPDHFGEFCLEHFQPKMKYPGLADKRENLLLACPACNAFKGNYDPTDIVNPLIEDYSKYFAEQSDGSLTATTTEGQRTLAVLNLNRPQLRAWRQQERRLRDSITDILTSLSSLGDFDDLVAKLNDPSGENYDARALIQDLHSRLSNMSQVPETFEEDGSPAVAAAVSWTQVDKELTPFVMSHFKNSPGDLTSVDPLLFEKIIAEYFASIECRVELLGQNPKTGADILAVRTDDAVGLEIRYMIEVKRWKQKVGIEVIDRVLGTLTREKPTFGWNIGLIVSLAGFKNFRATDAESLKKLGVYLKGKEEVLDYLRSYKPRPDGGLWIHDGWDAGIANF
jgi:hypothetical protein